MCSLTGSSAEGANSLYHSLQASLPLPGCTDRERNRERRKSQGGGGGEGEGGGGTTAINVRT